MKSKLLAAGKKLTSGVNEAEPRPRKTFAFGLRGDIWRFQWRSQRVAGRNADLARRLTDWAGDDSIFLVQRCKEAVFHSDRDFSTSLRAGSGYSQSDSSVERDEDITVCGLTGWGAARIWVAVKKAGFTCASSGGEPRRIVHVRDRNGAALAAATLPGLPT